MLVTITPVKPKCVRATTGCLQRLACSLSAWMVITLVPGASEDHRALYLSGLIKGHWLKADLRLAVMFGIRSRC